MSEELKDRPLSELSSIDNVKDVSNNDMILVSKVTGEYENYLSRNLKLGTLADYMMASFVAPLVSDVSTQISSTTSADISALSSFVDLSVVHSEDANFGLSCQNKEFISYVSQKNGVVSAKTGNLEAVLNMAQYCKKAELCTVISADGCYVAGVRQKDGRLDATLSSFSPILSHYTTKSSLNMNAVVPSNSTITSISQKDGLLSVNTVPRTFTLSAPDGQYIKSISSAEHGTLTAKYKAFAKCNVTCDETEYIKSIKLSEDDVQITKAKHVDLWPMKACLEAIYPVGAIYLDASSASICPLQKISGMTWEWIQVSQDKAVWGSNAARSNVGTSIDAGLPNITGDIIIRHRARSPYTSGAFQIQYVTNSPKWHFESCGCKVDDAYSVNLNANRSSPIYGSSSTVQPPAYVVTVWKRIY